jgi:subtilase family protein
VAWRAQSDLERGRIVLAAEFTDWVNELAFSSGVDTGATGLGTGLMALADARSLASTVLTRRLGAPPALAVEGKRYIVAPRMYEQASASLVTASLRAISDKLSPAGRIIRSAHHAGPKVLRLSALEATVLKERFPSLIVEEDTQYSLARSPLVGTVSPISVPAASSRSIVVSVTCEGRPVPGCRVQFFPRASQFDGYEATTDGSGTLRLNVRASDSTFERVVVPPPAGCWSRVIKNVPASSSMSIELRPLKPRGFDWGHKTTEAEQRGTLRGSGVTVAIIDSGIAKHPNLRVDAGQNFIEGEPASGWDNDESGHGTHCAGIVAALVRNAGMEIWGYVPDARLLALRVFGGADGGGYASDIADAIDKAVEMGADVISMSLTSETPNSYMRKSIEKATSAGVLCVAAAGNASGAVGYPAKYRHVVGVSAIGRADTYPADSIHVEAETALRSSDGECYLAAFSNRGDDIDLCAPGVAITSTYPAEDYAAWDGTSMACPHVAGIAALVVEASVAVRESSRGAERVAAIGEVLQKIAKDLGLSRQYQGAGLPLISNLAEFSRP